MCVCVCVCVHATCGPDVSVNVCPRACVILNILYGLTDVSIHMLSGLYT